MAVDSSAGTPKHINKVVYGDQVLIDLTQCSLIAPSDLLSGTTAYNRAGELLTGTTPRYGSSKDEIGEYLYDIEMIHDSDGDAILGSEDEHDYLYARHIWRKM